MNLFLMLLPAIAWGILPLAVAKVKGQPINQIFGTAVGTLLASVVVFLVMRPSISTLNFILAMVTGAFWVMGSVRSIHWLP